MAEVGCLRYADAPYSPARVQGPATGWNTTRSQSLNRPDMQCRTDVESFASGAPHTTADVARTSTRVGALARAPLA
jgi:hypothetical protein